MSVEKWSIFNLLTADVRARIRLFAVLGANGNEAIFITDDDEAFGFGTNYSYCLGYGDYGATLEPRRIDALCGQKVKAFSYGASPHVMAITGEGAVYAWGHNGHSQLGNGTQSLSNVPVLSGAGSGMRNVVRVACGSFHTLALTAEGEVFAWGQNSCGQIGSGCLANQAHPRKVTACIGPFKAVDIACSQSSSFAVLENGEIYAWGYNGNGQLGSGNAINQATPSRCTALAGIVVTRVVCGYAHILALTDQGHIYAWGANTYGQLGNGTKLNSSIPVRIAPDLGRFIDIAAVHAASISAAVTDTGKVYMWGQVRGQFVTVPLESPFDNLDDVFACCSHPAITFRAIQTKKSMLKDLVAAAFNDENTADIRFVCDDAPDRPIFCHKSILRIRCLYFQKMFAEPWSDREKEIITVQDYPYKVYFAFLKYLYTETVSLGTDEVLQLLDLANAYCEENLMHDCTNLIKHGVDSANAAFIYDYALRFNAKELEEYCFRYMLNHMTEITQTKTFLKLDETTVKNFITKASQNGAFRT
ncbi:RCC1 and BTB domain-containing protein 1-like [Paramacrobiotus metropolitanus]|uniref:RCC1 and BTB domain-containing protein 1-like n=1 Tax=Paramacrobiotus metropolitanus TaxID=2943436 RepID=UPI0024460ACD|nr:RCC1 and BTB domain-containing protein 1-like [Paramacrobiotus metropolitanus]XP_055343323.1 RCC1 and BTB domain-containing protein 1-like [Paramacrobiotus metropolitanus]